MNWLKTHKALLAYVFLALMVAYAVFRVQTQAIEFHDDSTRQTVAIRQSQFVGCARTNELRSTLQKLVLDTSQAKKLVKEGTITEAQYQRVVVQAKQNAAQLKPVDCAKLYPPVKVTK